MSVPNDATVDRAAHSATTRIPVFLAAMHPLDYLRVLYRRRWLVGVVVAAALAAAVGLTVTAVPTYEAQATVLVDSDQPTVVTFQDVLNEGAGRDGYFQTQLQLLTSRTLAQRTAKVLDLARNPEFGAPGDAAADKVLDGLRVAAVRGTRMVNVRFRSPDPSMAADIANAHARQYVEQSYDLRLHASKEATDWLNAQLADERIRVNRAEASLQAYREQHDAVSLAAGQNIVVQKLADLNAEVTRARTNRIGKEAAYRGLLVLQRGNPALEAFPAILSNPFIQQLKSDLARLQREASEMEGILGDQHPTLLAKRTEVATTERRLAAEVARVVDSERNAYQSALAEETSLVDALEQQKREALALSRRGIEYAALEREAESVRLVYQNLLQRAKETSVSSDLRITNIRIVDSARRPTDPVLPRPGFNLAVGLFGGLALAVGLVFGLEYVDDRARTPDDVRMRIRLPVLGLLPQFRRSRTGSPDTAALLAPHVEPALVEAVRGIRTSLVTSVDGSRPRSIVVTSAQAGEGKTFVASSLAVALAQAQQRVLLIDADMRRPTLQRLFDLRLEPGLSNVLAEEVPLGDVLHSTSVPGLTVLSGGTPTADAPELLASPSFHALLAALQQHYSWVIIDSPPVLSVTDPALLGQLATGVVFVVASGSTSARAARAAVDDLEAAGATIIGAALTWAAVRQHPLYFSPYTSGHYRSATPERQTETGGNACS